MPFNLIKQRNLTQEEYNRDIINNNNYYLITDGKKVDVEYRWMGESEQNCKKGLYFKGNPNIIKVSFDRKWNEYFHNRITLLELKQYYRERGLRVGFFCERFGNYYDETKMEEYINDNGNLQDLTSNKWKFLGDNLFILYDDSNKEYGYTMRNISNIIIKDNLIFCNSTTACWGCILTNNTIYKITTNELHHLMSIQRFKQL